jgi:AcrR family transcriptional regulator
MAQRPRPGLTRERVMEVAAAMFRERGYEKTSLNAIGEQLGVSAAALYYHFRSKDEILFAYLESGFEVVLDRTVEAMTASAPDERLRQLIRTYVLFDLGELPGSEFFSAGVFGYFQLAESLDQQQRRRLEKAQRAYLELIRSTITDGVKAGIFETEDVTAAAFALVGMAAHAVHWFKAGRKLSATDVADLYAEYAVRLLTPAG